MAKPNLPRKFLKFGFMTMGSTMDIVDNNVFFEINAEGFCVKTNKTVAIQTGYLPQEFIGKKFRDFIEIEASFLNSLADKITTKEQVVVSFDSNFKHKSGSLIFMGWTMFWSAQSNTVTCIGKPFSTGSQKLVKENQNLRLLNEVNECLQQHKSRQELLDDLCKILLKFNKSPLVWIWEIVKNKSVRIIHKDSTSFISTESLVQTELLNGLITGFNLIEGLNKLEVWENEEFGVKAKNTIGYFDRGALIPINTIDDTNLVLGIVFSDSKDNESENLHILDTVCEKLTKTLNGIISEERLKVNEGSLNKYIRELNLLNEVNNQILVAQSEEDLIKQILNTLNSKGGYKLAWIGFFEKGKEKEKLILPSILAGETEYALDLSFDLNDAETLKGPTADCILTLKTSVQNSTIDDPNYSKWRDKAQKHGLASSISIYLDLNGNEKAVMCIYSERKNSFDYRETLILERLSHNLVFAINGIRNLKQSKQIRSKLNETKILLEDYKQAMDQIAIISITDCDGKITYVNKTFEEIYGLTSDQIVGKTHKSIGSDFHSDEFWAHLWKTITAGLVWNGEIKNIDKDGRERWYDTTIYSFTSVDNKPYQYMCISWDVTNQLELKEKDKLISRIIESSHDAIYSVNLEGAISSWNQGAEIMFGYSEEEIIGKPVLNLINEDLKSTELKIAKAIQNGKNIEEFETIGLKKNKDLVHIQISVYPLRDEQNELMGYTKIAKDINRLKLAEIRAEKFSTDLSLREKQFLLLEELSKLSKDHNKTSTEILKEVVNLIPSAMQFSDIASAKIIHENHTIVNDRFKESLNYITCSKHDNPDYSHLFIYYPDNIEFRNEEKLLIELVCNWTELISNSRSYSQSLKERIKEINLLIELNKIFNQENTEFNILFETFAKRIPLAWQFPEKTEVRIIYGNQEFYSNRFRDYIDSIEVTFNTIDGKKGSIQVVVLEKISTSGSNFLKEEVDLLKAVSISIQTKLDQLILRNNIFNSEVRLNKIIDYSSTAYMLLNQNLDIIYSNKKSLEFGKTFYNLDLSKGKNIIIDQKGEKSEEFELAFSKLDANNEIEFINEHIDKDGRIHVFEVRLFKTKIPKQKEFEIILIANDISHLKQREEDVNNLVNLLKDLNFITSFEISHEFHKLQSIVELAQDLDFIDTDLKLIFSNSSETFKKGNNSIKKLIERINIPLKKEIAIASSLKRIEKLILIDEDEISVKISSKILEKFFDPIQIISFPNSDECTSYFKSTGDNGNNIILLEMNLENKDGIKFIENYISNKLQSPILLMGSNNNGEIQKLLAGYSFVRNFIQKPINKETAEKIFTKDVLVN